MTGPLAGLRVADFGQYVAGPLAAVLLADQGADVIHVDPPGGPRMAGAADAFLNRGKRRAILDLKRPGDLAAARRIAAAADVVIENFRPGVLTRLGLDLDAIRQEHPALITCSLPGFAADDPRASLRGYEGVIAAATANCTPRTGEEPTGWDWERPTYSALPLASSFAAYLAAVSIVMALIARRRTGRGQRCRGAAVRRDVHPHRAQRRLRERARAPAAAAHSRARRGRVPLPGRQVRAVRHLERPPPVLVRPRRGPARAPRSRAARPHEQRAPRGQRAPARRAASGVPDPHGRGMGGNRQRRRRRHRVRQDTRRVDRHRARSPDARGRPGDRPRARRHLVRGAACRAERVP